MTHFHEFTFVGALTTKLCIKTTFAAGYQPGEAFLCIAFQLMTYRFADQVECGSDDKYAKRLLLIFCFIF